MKRLTADNKDGTVYYPHCFRDDTCGGMGTGDCGTCDFSQKVCNRLAAYERTGLTPEEVQELKEFVDNIPLLATAVPAAVMEPEWIPVEERLPKSGQTVLAFIKHNYVEDGWRAYRVYEYTDHWVGMGNLCDVLAWMPLPQPYCTQLLKEAGKEAAQGGLFPLE